MVRTEEEGSPPTEYSEPIVQLMCHQAWIVVQQ
jgi:hypothetical protein